MKFIDSHCHLHDSRIVSDVDSIIKRAKKADVTYMVTCSTMEENFEKTSELSITYDSILPCFGIHPWFVKGVSDQWKDRLEQYLLNHPAGIGETGLDFTDKTWDRDQQIQVFTHHLILARELKRPITIHIRKAWDSFIHILKRIGKLPVPGVLHSYSGSADMIPFFERNGLYVSFSGSVTNPGAKKVVKALQTVSKDRLVLETDTPDIFPYLPGVKRSGLNEPKNLPAIAKIASQRIGMGFEEFVRYAHENTTRLFHPLLPAEKEN